MSFVVKTWRNNAALHSAPAANPLWASHTETSKADCLFLTNEGTLQVKKENSVVKPKDAPKADAPKDSDPNPAEAKFKEFYDKSMGQPQKCNHGACQCVALFNFYNEDILHHGFIQVSYAYELHGAAPDSDWEKLPANAAPRKGDVAIWGNTWKDNPAGHVTIVESDNGDRVNVISQNPGPVEKLNLPKTSLVGYLRPKL